jgi:L-lactate dehydrogenase complex protein LldG
MSHNIHSKDNILKRIREVENKDLIIVTEQKKEIIEKEQEDILIRFAEAFQLVGGEFIYCANATDLSQQLTLLTQTQGWRHLYLWEHSLQDFMQRYKVENIRIGRQLDSADAGITLCEALVAETGSIVISTAQSSGRILSIFPPNHIVIASVKQVVESLGIALANIAQKYKQQMPSMLSVITGPSRTADIEKTLVKGAHGSKKIVVFVVDN